jgi:hypothetical protein
MSETFTLNSRYSITQNGGDLTLDDEAVAIIRRSALAKVWDEGYLEGLGDGIYSLCEGVNPYRGEQA